MSEEEKLDPEIEDILDVDEPTDLAGRPTKMTTRTVALLLTAFSNSFTDEEACIYADISKNTLYRYIDKHPEFWHQKEILKKKPNMKAKLNWLDKINKKDYQASKDWLERKAKDEFSLRTELWAKVDLGITISEEEQSHIDDILDNNEQK